MEDFALSIIEAIDFYNYISDIVHTINYYY